MYEDDYNYRNSGSHAEEQARRQFAQTKEQSINTVNSLVTVQEGKDGKKHWMGMEISPEIANTLQYLTSVAPTAVSDFLRGGVYQHTVDTFNALNAKFKFSTNPRAGQIAGVRAAAAVSALLIGAQPLIGTIHSVRQRGRDREAIRTALSAIVDTDKSAYENNEVIKTALERTNKAMVAGIKQAAAELPTVLLNSYYAVGSHKDLVRRESIKFNNAHPEISAGGKEAAEALIQKEGREEIEINELSKKYPNFSRERIERIYQEQAEDIRETRIRANSAVEEKPESQIQSAGKTVSLLGVGAINSLLKQTFAKGDEENNKPIAYQLILKLQENVNDGHISQGSNITDQIIEIFQQNEKDRGRSGVGAALLEKLQPLAERIGEVIANKELDPLALVNLVGDGKVINKRHFVKTEQLEELLDVQRKIFGSHEKTPLDEMLADFQNPKMIMGAIVEALQTLRGRDKAIFASLFSDDVLLHAGIKKKEIPSLRTEGHDGFFEIVKTKTVELAKNSSEELKKLGRSEAEIEGIKSLNELIISGKDKEVKSTIERGDGVVAAVRNAMLQKQVEGKEDAKTYWTRIIKQKPSVITVEKTPDMSTVERISTGRESGLPALGMV